MEDEITIQYGWHLIVFLALFHFPLDKTEQMYYYLFTLSFFPLSICYSKDFEQQDEKARLVL
jgi:hypothetical protein